MAGTGTLTAIEVLRMELGALDEELVLIDEQVHSLHAQWQDAEDRFAYVEQQRVSLADAIAVLTERGME